MSRHTFRREKGLREPGNVTRLARKIAEIKNKPPWPPRGQISALNTYQIDLFNTILLSGMIDLVYRCNGVLQSAVGGARGAKRCVHHDRIGLHKRAKKVVFQSSPNKSNCMDASVYT